MMPFIKAAHRHSRRVQITTPPGMGAIMLIFTMLAVPPPSAVLGDDADTSRGGSERKLPAPVLEGTVSVEEAIAKRRSVRSYTGTPLSDVELSQILWAAQGVTDSARGLRAAPSAGATYPLETYVATAEGLFHYVPATHALKRLRNTDLRPALSSAALQQSWVRTASAVVIFAAVPQRTASRYGARATRYIDMEAGHAAQNVHLQAVALGLGSVPIGAFEDQKVATVIGLPKEQGVLYLIPVGR